VISVDGLGAAFAPFAAELAELVPAETVVVDAHTHLGADEDGRSQDLSTLLGQLELVGADSRACVFPLHDPDRSPAYRRPNDRVLAWADQSDGRLTPYCRLDPADHPVREAERCLALGARGIKLHPRAQAFGFDDPAAEAIFTVARDARVPILIHAGRGMPPMDPLAELALRFPEVSLVLAHAGIAGQGMFASRLADHPSVLYDTSAFAAIDVVELFARVPAERIVFASDSPYGQPLPDLYLAMRAAVRAGVDAPGRAMIAGGTMAAVLDHQPLPAPREPRLGQVRPVNGRLLRISGYLMMAFGAAATANPPDVTMAHEGVALARYACRDPDPGNAGPAIRRIDDALAAAERILATGDGDQAAAAIAVAVAAATVAATEPVVEPASSTEPGSAQVDGRGKTETFELAVRAWNRGELDQVVAALSDDHEWDLSHAGIPGETGIARGPDAYLAFAARWREALGPTQLEIVEARELPDGRLFIQLEQSATGPRSGARVNLDYVQILTFEGEQIVRSEVFNDHREGRIAAGLAQPDKGP
jgi:ketosteroid isomerase-like protein